MNNWQIKQLSEVASVIGGGTPSTANPSFWDGDISWLTPKDLSGYNFRYISAGGRNITEDGLRASAAKIMPKNAILFTSRAPIGYVAIAGGNVCTNQGFKSLVVNNDQCPLFYYYLLKNNVEFIEGIASGSTFKEVSGSQLANLSFEIPRLEEQKAIADVLGSLDDKIESNRRENETLEAIVTALFKSWFVDFEPFGGAMPDGWEEKPLADIAEYLNGIALQKYPAKDGDPYLPVIKIAELNRGVTESTDKASADIPSEYIVRDGDVLFSWSGSLMAILWAGGEGALNQHLFKVSSAEYPKWFYYLWTKYHMPFFQMIAQSKATTMGHIKREHLREVKAIIPTDDKMAEITATMQPIIDKIILNAVQSRTLEQIRDSLLPRLMSGKIRIPPFGEGDNK